MNNLINEWENITKVKVFEIPVIDRRTDERKYILFNLELEGGYLYAYHEPLNTEEQNSDKIAYENSNIDSDYSLDENIQELYEKCIHYILISEFFTLAD